MTPIRTRDKLFCAVVIPLALAAAYVFLWRNAAVRQTEGLRGEVAALVCPEDFPQEKMRAERQLTEAQAEKAAEAKIPPPAVKVRPTTAVSEAGRDLAVQRVFLRAGLRVVSSAPTETPDANVCAVLQATDAYPTTCMRTYVLEGRYPEVLAALSTFVTDEMAVVPVSVSLQAAQSDRWQIVLCL